MNLKTNFCCFMVLAVFLTCGLNPAMAEENRKFKVLVVMSYHEDMIWVADMKKAIDSTLARTCELKYFYLDTRNNFEGGTQKAKEAYELFLEYKPDGVLAADDDAQVMFVVPYLKDKVKTPVIFCGVNAEPEQYGYPASNVSGVLERIHFKESIAFLQTIVPSVSSIGYLMGDNPTSQGYYQQIQNERETYSAKSADIKFAKTIDESLVMATEFKNSCDALFIDNTVGIKDKKGNSLEEKQVIPFLAKSFGKATFGANISVVKSGLLCAVVKTGQEQGETSANMLLKAMQGTPVSEFPITRNYQGKRMINVTVLKELGIRPRPEIIGSAELVRTEN
ncbi:MAG: ABC transporter substrate-binding protein [Desulfococcaceae bacterium]